MLASDIARVHALAQSSPGVAFAQWETEELLQEALELNFGLPHVAVNLDTKDLVGAVFLSNTGIRGIFHHLVVDAQSQGQGIGRALVETSLVSFRQRSRVRRIVCLVLTSNPGAIQFWLKLGFQLKSDTSGAVAFLVCNLD